MNKKLFTSESVSSGHPDKVCDQISDAVLDAFLTQDPNARVACETFATTGLVVVGGEITADGWVNFQEIARKVLSDIAIHEPDSFRSLVTQAQAALNKAA